MEINVDLDDLVKITGITIVIVSVVKSLIAFGLNAL